MTRRASLDLGVTGNCIISALIDREARIVWSCLPRLDGDPVFHALVDDGAATGRGAWAIELTGFERSEQEYVRQHGGARHAALQRERLGGRSHRFLPALRAQRAHVPAADAACAGCARSPARRESA